MPRFAVPVNLAQALLAIGLLALGGCYGGGVQTGAPLFAAGAQPAPGPTPPSQPTPMPPLQPTPAPTPAPQPTPMPAPAPSPPPVGQCSEGLAAVDLAGQCRASPPTMGALEAVGDAASTATSAITSSASLAGTRPADGGNAAAYLIRLWSKW